jgi:hypothetical protein
MNNTERDISMSQGWETAVVEYEAGIELGCAELVCMGYPF